MAIVRRRYIHGRTRGCAVAASSVNLLPSHRTDPLLVPLYCPVFPRSQHSLRYAESCMAVRRSGRAAELQRRSRTHGVAGHYVHKYPIYRLP